MNAGPLQHHSFLRISLLLLVALISALSLAPSTVFAQGNPVEPQSNTKQSLPSVADSPVSIAFIIDISMSVMETQEMNQALYEPLSHFVESGHQQNEYFIVGVSSAPRIFLDGSADKKATLKVLSKIKRIKPEGASALYDACYLAVKRVMQSGYSRKYVLVFSDGEDTISEKSLNDLLALLKNKDMTIYAVNFRQPRNVSALKSIRVLEQITSATGGETYNPRKREELGVVFEDIKRKLWP